MTEKWKGCGKGSTGRKGWLKNVVEEADGKWESK
jgi:hypothetical protein